MPAIGLSRLQQDTLDRHLSAGKRSNNGLLLAAMQCGMIETFQGKALMTTEDPPVLVTGLTGLDADKDPYHVVGANQYLGLRSSDATPTASTAGIPVASTTASTTGVLRLTNRDLGTGANGAQVAGVSQEGSLWIPGSTPWVAQFELTVPKNAYGTTIAFQEIGLMGAGDIATHFIDVSKEFGYVDGTSDAAFVALKFYNGNGYLRIRPATAGTILTSAAFPIPASGKHTYRIENNYSSTGGTPTVSLFIDDAFVVSIAATVASGLQFAARACHGAAYTAASHVPPVFDIDTIVVAVNP